MIQKTVISDVILISNFYNFEFFEINFEDLSFLHSFKPYTIYRLV